MALDLAKHRGNRVAREAAPAVGVVAVHSLDEAHARDLNQVLERLASMTVTRRKLPRQRHEADHQLIASFEVPLPVVAQKEPVVLEPPCLGRLSRRLPDQDGWCHVSHITLSGRCETCWVSDLLGQLTVDASSTISSLSSRRVMVKTRCTGSGPRTITTRRPASRARSSAVTRQRSPVESRKVRRDRSSTTTGGSSASTRRNSSWTLATVERSNSPFRATCTSPLRSSVSTSRISTGLNLAQSCISREPPGEHQLDAREGQLERALRKGIREEHADDHAQRRKHSDHDAVAQPQIAVFALPPGSDEGHEHDRDQRSGHGLEL